MTSVVPISGNDNLESSQFLEWKMGLFDIGNIADCTYAYLCPDCALSESLHEIDGSPFCFTVLSWSIFKMVHKLSELHKIPMDSSCCSGDSCAIFLCNRCIANRIYQTTRRRINGKNPSHFGDINGNGNWELELFQCGSPLLALYACCCPKIAISHARLFVANSPVSVLFFIPYQIALGWKFFLFQLRMG